MSSPIFRKVALEKLSTPEQLDQLVRVTTPKGWLALIALGGAIVAAVLWGFYGRIPTKVKGNGVIIRRGGTFNIVATNAGRIVELNVPQDHVVSRGHVIARVAQPDLAAHVIAAKGELVDLVSQRETVASMTAADVRSRREDLARQRIFLVQKKAAAEKRKQGLITDSVANVAQQIDAVNEEILKNDHELAALPSRERALEVGREHELQRADLAINTAKRKLQTLEAQMKNAETIISPIPGHILSLQVAVGDLVNVGSVLCNVELADNDLIATVYVSPADGKKIDVGSYVQLSPADVKQEEYGYMVGRVSYVSKFPTTETEMMYLLQNDSLVKLFSSHGAPFGIEVELLADPSTPSGFKWSSAKSPPVSITSGTVCTAGIVVSEKRPIEMVIPYLREKLGV